VISYRINPLFGWKSGVAADQAAIVAKLEEIAELGGVGLMPHTVAVQPRSASS
jgi:hypothetical protein